jgi:hypothetical protein
MLHCRQELEAEVLALSAYRSSEMRLHAGVAGRGCADVSLYRRFVDAGLVDLHMGPQLTLDAAERSTRWARGLADQIESSLSAEELHQLRAAVARAEQDRTLIVARLYHCAVWHACVTRSIHARRRPARFAGQAQMAMPLASWLACVWPSLAMGGSS